MPERQVRQSLPCAGEYRPGGQGVQLTAAFVLNLPGGHAPQAVDPGLPLKLPRLQSEHLTSPAMLKLPAGQMRQACKELPSGAIPAGHWAAQADEPEGLNVPRGAASARGCSGVAEPPGRARPAIGLTGGAKTAGAAVTALLRRIGSSDVECCQGPSCHSLSTGQSTAATPDQAGSCQQGVTK